MKNVYPIQVIDLSFQVNYITLRKIQLIEEFSEDPDKERLFVILIKHRQNEIISGGNKILKLKLYN